MKIVIFGFSVSSSWGNGRATQWRALIDALSARGHRVVFFERSVAYHASEQDCAELHPAELVVYTNWDEALRAADERLEDADAALVTSQCPDAAAACERVLGSQVPIKVFYEYDAPLTLQRAKSGQPIPHLPSQGFDGFDLVLSATGGSVLEELSAKLGARRVAPLYGCADLRVFSPVERSSDMAAELSYLGAHSAERYRAFESLFLTTARTVPQKRFIVGGSQYPNGLDWPKNVRHVQHVFPNQKAAFYCASPMTLSLVRPSMASKGYCPPVRIFEASACGVPVVTDDWAGLAEFYEPGREILVVHTTQDMLVTLSRSAQALQKIGKAARERTLAQHTADHRAAQLVEMLASLPEPRVVSRPQAESLTQPAQRYAEASVSAP